MATLVNGYTRLRGVAENFQSLALLVLRIGIGFGLWFSAYGHLTHVEDMVKRFTEWGVPLPRLSVYVSAATEATGGILLVLGLATRLISIPLFFNFVVAYATARKDEFRRLFGITHGNGPWDAWADVVNDSAMPFLVASLVTFAFGAGKLSVDYLLEKAFRRLAVWFKGLPVERIGK